MPSSSTGTTHTEIRLTNLYIKTYHRLLHAASHESAAFITTQFSKLLDVPISTLVRRVTSDRDVFDRWKRNIQADKKSDVLFTASHYLGDVATELKEKGREVEALEWMRWAEEVVRMAERAEDREKWDWRRSGG